MKRLRPTPKNPASRGFTLTELAIVLVIVTLLVGGMLVSVSTSRDITNEKEAQKQLASITEALLGFAMDRQRLPCPATAAAGDTGVENPAGGPICAAPYTGFLPGITLGLAPTDAQGYVIDPWGNRIRYAVTTASANAYTTFQGVKNQWNFNPQADLHVCSLSPGIPGGNCGAGNDLTTTAVAVIFSTGRNGGAPPPAANTDELANWIDQYPPPHFTADGIDQCCHTEEQHRERIAA